MNKNQVVKIGAFRGMSLSWNLNLFNGPKFDLRCGKCRHGWRERIQMVDYPTVTCPRCNTVNEIPLITTTE